MNLTVTLLNTFVVVAVGAILTFLTNDRFRLLRREMTELKSGIARVEARLDAGIAAVRSDIVQVALAVGAKRDAAQG
ncbi:MAG: hypothetical protein AUI83_26205 [Armatimonadetes bacterium 13_1_40CM_3_65_7]|nr:MAG: hypothetical protein AUI83_26205 [Armatimonadetes bacterium 13_1_40CM_3_65_7]